MDKFRSTYLSVMVFLRFLFSKLSRPFDYLAFEFMVLLSKIPFFKQRMQQNGVTIASGYREFQGLSSRQDDRYIDKGFGIFLMNVVWALIFLVETFILLFCHFEVMIWPEGIVGFLIAIFIDDKITSSAKTEETVLMLEQSEHRLAFVLLGFFLFLSAAGLLILSFVFVFKAGRS